MRQGMMLDKLVGKVVAAFAPTDNVFVLGDVVLDPVKTHAPGFGAALRDCVIDDAQCASIVSLYWRGSLRVSTFEQCDTEMRCIFGVMKKRARFGFSGRGQNRFHYG